MRVIAGVPGIEVSQVKDSIYYRIKIIGSIDTWRLI